MARTVPRPDFRYLLANRPFGLLWASQAISTLGDLLYDIALLWYVLDTTGSALAAGGIAVISGVGFLLGGAAAGLVLDRVPVRQILLGADLARLAMTLAVSAAWLAGFVPPLVVLYALTFAVSLATASFNPARAAAVPQVVPPEHLLHANALEAVSNSMARIIALTLSGVLVAAVGPAPALLVDAGTFLLSSLLVYRARWQPAPSDDREQAGPLSAALEGLHWARADPLARTLLAAETLHALAAGFFVSALAPFVRELGGGPALYGAQGGLFSLGLLLGSAALGYRPTRRLGRLYAGGITLNAIGNILFGLSPSPVWTLPTVFVAGLGGPGWSAGKRSLLQAHVPPRVLGRVFALLDTLTALTVIPTYALGGWLVDLVGARWIAIVAPAVHLGIGLCLSGSHRVRSAALRQNLAGDDEPGG